MKELRKQLKAAVEEMRKMLDKATEEKRGLTEDEQTEYDKLETKTVEIQGAIKVEEDSKGLEGLEKHLKEPAKKEPAKIEPKSPADEKRFKSLGEFLGAVIRADSPADVRIVDPRLAEIRAATGMGEAVPADGGFVVQTDFASEILKKSYETGQLASRINKIPIGPNSKGLVINAIDETSRQTGSRWGGVQIYPVAEADTVTAKKPTFRQMELKLNKIMGLVYLTDELVSDTTALEAIVNQAFTEEFGFTIDNYIFRGTGVGQPAGIMSSPSLITVSRNAANDFKVADLKGMWKQFWSPGRARAVWLINQVIEPEFWDLVISNQPVYMPPGGLSGKPFGTLLGLPVITIEQASDDVGTTGDIMLADLSQYMIIDKGSMESASSLHVRFLYDEQVLRFTYRVDGQSTWNSPLTTFGGNNTVSPFVVLSTSN